MTTTPKDNNQPEQSFTTHELLEMMHQSVKALTPEEKKAMKDHVLQEISKPAEA